MPTICRLLTFFVLSAHALADEDPKCTYTVGIFNRTEAQVSNFQYFKPVYEEYLTSSAGVILGKEFGCDGPVRFQTTGFILKHGETYDPLQFIANKQMDFATFEPLMVACFGEEFEIKNLLSIHTSLAGSGTKGGVIFTRANAPMQSISDFKNKIFVSNFWFSMPDFVAASQILLLQGFNVWQDPKQIKFLGLDVGILVRQVLSGEADVGLISDESLEQFIVSTGMPISAFKFWGCDDDASQAYFYDKQHVNEFSCTMRVGMSAFVSLDVNARVEQEVIKALVEFNGSSIQGQQTKIAAFQAPEDHQKWSSILQEQHMLKYDPRAHTRKCNDDIVSMVFCSAGTFRRPAADLLTQCSKLNIPCAGSSACVCNPCIDGQEIAIYPVLDVDLQNGTANVIRDKACRKMKTCTSAVQGSLLRLVVIDNIQRDDVNVTYIVHAGVDSQDDNKNVTFPLMVANQSTVVPHAYYVDLWERPLGSALVEVYIDGVQAYTSPFWIFTSSQPCTAGQEHDEAGFCQCSRFSSNIGSSKCVPFSTVAPAIAVPILAVLLLLGYLRARHIRKKNESMWLINIEELVFPDPPRVLGFGTFGKVIAATYSGPTLRPAATYRGTEVAVKRRFPTRELAMRHATGNGPTSNSNNNNANNNNSSNINNNTPHERRTQSFFGVRKRRKSSFSTIAAGFQLEDGKSCEAATPMSGANSAVFKSTKTLPISESNEGYTHEDEISNSSDEAPSPLPRRDGNADEPPPSEGRGQRRKTWPHSNSEQGSTTPTKVKNKGASFRSTSSMYSAVADAVSQKLGLVHREGQSDLSVNKTISEALNENDDGDITRSLSSHSVARGNSIEIVPRKSTSSTEESNKMIDAGQEEKLRHCKETMKGSNGSSDKGWPTSDEAKDVCVDGCKPTSEGDIHVSVTPSLQHSSDVMMPPGVAHPASLKDPRDSDVQTANEKNKSQRLKDTCSDEIDEHVQDDARDVADKAFNSTHSDVDNTSNSSTANFTTREGDAQTPTSRHHKRNSGVSTMPLCDIPGQSKKDSKLLPVFQANSSMGGSITMTHFKSSMSKGLLPAIGLPEGSMSRRNVGLAAFINEIKTMSRLRHPNITTVMGAVVRGTNGELLVVMELMENGSLHDILHNDTFVIEGDFLMPILGDVVQGMRFLHSADPPQVHGDLKSANILIDANFRAKVSDFCFTTKINGAMLCGTPFWMAPELLKGETNCTPASDAYAFGITLFEMFSRKEPYAGQNYQDVVRKVMNSQGTSDDLRPGVPPACPGFVATMMQKCWSTDRKARPTFEEISETVKSIELSGVSIGGKAIDLLRRNKQTNDVLFDVFPKHIAEALIEGRKIAPERKECVTIFFSDIVGFTSISATMDPAVVSDMLNRLYLAFDALSREHHVFKVETVGDAWVGITNLVEDQENDHAARLARFAIEVVKVANHTLIDEHDPSKGTIQIRVGLHSGSVVANVVGSRNKKYCLFGDSVNTASRMESNSKAGRIHASKAAAVLIHQQAPDLVIEDRGIIKIKGKGGMQTYWICEATGDSPPTVPASLFGQAHSELSLDLFRQPANVPPEPIFQPDIMARRNSHLPASTRRGSFGSLTMTASTFDASNKRPEWNVRMPSLFSKPKPAGRSSSMDSPTEAKEGSVKEGSVKEGSGDEDKPPAWPKNVLGAVRTLTSSASSRNRSSPPEAAFSASALGATLRTRSSASSGPERVEKSGMSATDSLRHIFGFKAASSLRGASPRRRDSFSHPRAAARRSPHMSSGLEGAPPWENLGGSADERRPKSSEEADSKRWNSGSMLEVKSLRKNLAQAARSQQPRTFLPS